MTDLQNLEMETYQTLWKDGLLDLFVGAGLILTGFAWLVGLFWMGMIIPAVLIALWPLARRSISAPRAGSFTPSRQRQAWEQGNLLALALAGVAALGLFGPGWAFVLGGAAVLLWGGVVLVRFLMSTARLPEESP